MAEEDCRSPWPWRQRHTHLVMLVLQPFCQPGMAWSCCFCWRCHYQQLLPHVCAADAPCLALLTCLPKPDAFCLFVFCLTCYVLLGQQ